MQIIDELEPGSRGLYAGAVGYIGFDNQLEFAIAIRTADLRDGIASVQAGAGIVADSCPSKEWTETNDKAEAMRSAIRAAGGSGMNVLVIDCYDRLYLQPGPACRGARGRPGSCEI